MNQNNALSGIMPTPPAWNMNTGMVASGVFMPISGQLVEDPEPDPVEEVEEYATPSYADEDCAHDWLVNDRDDQGNKYWCKVCDRRFKEHPGADEIELPPGLENNELMKEAAKMASTSFNAQQLQQQALLLHAHKSLFPVITKVVV
jgi:hypothetical protein